MILSRRNFAAAAATSLLTTRVIAQSQQTVRAGEDGESASDPGPENTGLKALNSDNFMPPATDHGSVQTFWSSFSAMHRRVQEGGWSRQVNQTDFPISTDIAGVNMRLTAGGVRELHWHAADEWALMLDGKDSGPRAGRSRFSDWRRRRRSRRQAEPAYPCRPRHTGRQCPRRASLGGAHSAHAGSRANRKSGSFSQGQGQGDRPSADPAGRLSPYKRARHSLMAWSHGAATFYAPVLRPRNIDNRNWLRDS